MVKITQLDDLPLFILEYDFWEDFEHEYADMICVWCKATFLNTQISHIIELESKDVQIHYKSCPVKQHITLSSDQDACAFKLRWC